MKTILRSLGTSRQALLPQIRILEEHYLIKQTDDNYELTTIGKLIVKEMSPLVGTTKLFDIDIDYWGNHKLDFLPQDLLERISELGQCELITPQITEIYEFNTEFYEHSKKSKSVFRISTFFHPMYSKLYPVLMQLGVEIYLILSQEVIDMLRDKTDKDFEELLEDKLFHLFVYPYELKLLTFAYNDYYLLVRLLKNDGSTDNQQILCSSPSAVGWGKELFEYYLKDSTPITKI